MTGTREWADGRPVPPDDVAWALAVTTSLGCGYVVRIPYGARDRAPLAAARQQAEEVAARLGGQLDEAPWQALADERDLGGPVEVTGLWEPQFRGPLGAARTRVTLRRGVARNDRTAHAVRLPWTYGSATAVAGLAVPAPHEEAMAAARLRREAADVGLWTDHRALLCTSTAGPLLHRAADGSWQHPGPSSGAVGCWLHDRLVAMLGSRPSDLPVSTAEAAGSSLWAVEAWGSLVQLGLRDVPGDAVLRRLRDQVLPPT